MKLGEWGQHDMMYQSVNKGTEVNFHGEWEFLSVLLMGFESKGIQCL